MRWPLPVLFLAKVIHCGDAIVQSAVAPALRRRAPRLQIITVTSTDRLEMAARIHEANARWMGPDDSSLAVCDPGCAAAAGSRIGEVVEMGDLEFPSGHCNHHNGSACSGYERAQLKFLWGLVQTVREMKQRGAPLPKWWLVKDDDTYLHANSLMEYVHDREAELVSMADGLLPSTPMAGGGGWLLSRALAERLALQHGEAALALVARAVVDAPGTTYDDLVPQMVRWVPGAEHSIFDPMNAECDEWSLRCLKPGAVTWHMRDQIRRKNLEEAIRAVDECARYHGL